MAGQIFISYRRSYGDRVGRIVDALIDAGYEGFELFRDVDDIAGGEAWTPQLERAMAQARLVLAVVGPGWASDKHGDWVRRELETALANRVEIVVAVLPDGRQELRALDPSLQPVLAGQAVTLGDELLTADVDTLVRALRRAGVHPSAATDRWTEALFDDDIGESARELRTIVATTAMSWQQGAPRPTPPVVIVDGPPGGGRSAALRAVLSDRTAVGARAPVALHVPTGSVRGHEPAAVAATWVAEVVRWAHAHAAPEVMSRIADALVQAIRAGLDGQRLPSDLVGLLPVRARSAWITAASEAPTGTHRQLVTTVIGLLDDLATAVPLVLGADDVHLLDATSVEVVRQVAERLAEEPERHVLLVLTAPPDDLLADVPAERQQHVVVGTPHLLQHFLDRCGIEDPTARAALAEVGVTTPTQAVAYLHHLRLHGLLHRDPSGSWGAGAPPADGWPTLDEALDATIDRFVLPTWQKVIGIGAFLGSVFSLAAALEVANRAVPAPDEVTACWDELRSCDPDEIVLRCREADGRRIVAFRSSEWWARLRERVLQAERGAPFGALATVVEATAADTFDAWLAAALLHEQADDPGSAGDAYLRAARSARLGLSDESAARAYTLAAGQLWEAAQRGDRAPAQMVRGLTRIAYCYYRASNLLAIAADDAGSRTTSERLQRTGADRLNDALQTLDAANAVMAEWRRHPSALPDLDLLVMDEADVLSEEEVRVELMLNTLTAYANLQRGRNLLAAKEPDHHRAEHHLLLALRHADQGLSGILRQQLVVRASAGMARALVPRVAKLTNATERRRAARAAFLHGTRSLLLRDVVGARADDPQALRALDQSVGFVLLSRASLAEVLDLPHLATHVHHRQNPLAADAPPALLVADIAKLACAPHRLQLASAIRDRAQELLDAQGAALALAGDTTLADDITIASFAQNLLRDVDGARLLAMCLDVGHPVDGEAWDRPTLLHGDATALVLQRDLGLAGALGDRFTRIRLAVGSHAFALDASDVPLQDAAFAMVMRLAGARARADLEPALAGGAQDDDISPEAEIHMWWTQAVEAGDVAGAYAALRRWRAS